MLFNNSKLFEVARSTKVGECSLYSGLAELRDWISSEFVTVPLFGRQHFYYVATSTVTSKANFASNQLLRPLLCLIP